MIPAGYLLKRVTPPPGWLGTPNIIDVCSLSDCVNDNVVDLQAAWRHNDFGLANDPKTLWELANSDVQDLKGSKLFYYEAYEYEIESDGWEFDPKSLAARHARAVSVNFNCCFAACTTAEGNRHRL